MDSPWELFFDFQQLVDTGDGLGKQISGANGQLIEIHHLFYFQSPATYPRLISKSNRSFFKVLNVVLKQDLCHQKNPTILLK